MNIPNTAFVACLLLTASAYAQAINITIQGTATGDGNVSYIQDAPFTLNIQIPTSSLVRNTTFSNSTFGIYEGSGIGFYRFQVADLDLHIDNALFSIDADNAFEKVEFNNVGTSFTDGQYIESQMLRAIIGAPDNFSINSSFLEDFVSTDPTDFQSWSPYISLIIRPNLVDFNNASSIYSSSITSVTMVSAIPEPSAFAAFAGIGVLALAAMLSHLAGKRVM